MTRKVNDTSISLLINDGISLSRRSIDLFGEVEENMLEKLMRGVSLLLDKDSTSPINIYISSYGGDVYDGFQMYDFIRSLETVEVKTYACGKVFSAAMLPFIAGDVRKMFDNAAFMVHSASSASRGKAYELSTDSKETEIIVKQMCEILAEHTNLDTKKWEKLIKYEDLYIRKDEAKKIGITTKEVIE